MPSYFILSQGLWGSCHTQTNMLTNATITYFHFSSTQFKLVLPILIVHFAEVYVLETAAISHLKWRYKKLKWDEWKLDVTGKIYSNLSWLIVTCKHYIYLVFTRHLHLIQMLCLIFKAGNMAKINGNEGLLRSF